MKTKLPIIILCAVFTLLSLRLCNKAYYYDELVSINTSFFTSPLEVATEYTTLNTHVLYSLVNNAYLRVVGVTDATTLLDSPWKLRLPQLIFPVVTLIYLFLISGTLTAPLLLATTIPFYYYSAGLRGYGMSMMLFTMFLYYALKRRQILAGVLGVALMYVMPSNAVFYAVGVALLWRTGILPTVPAVGVATLLLYSPIIPEMLNDPQLTAHDSHMRVLTESIPETLNAFISYRWILVPFAAWGLIGNTPRIRKGQLYLAAVVVSFIPFLISGNYLWARVMLPVLPLFCLAFAAGLESCWERI